MKRDWASELRAIADGRLMLNVRNGVTVSRSMLAMIADELDAERAAHAETKRERDEATERENAAREFIKSHPSLTLIDISEFEAFLNVPEAFDRAARRVREGGEANG